MVWIPGSNNGVDLMSGVAPGMARGNPVLLNTSSFSCGFGKKKEAPKKKHLRSNKRLKTNIIKRRSALKKKRMLKNKSLRKLRSKI